MSVAVTVLCCRWLVIATSGGVCPIPIYRHLKNSQNTAAFLTTFNEIDMTNIKALRTQYVRFDPICGHLWFHLSTCGRVLSCSAPLRQLRRMPSAERYAWADHLPE